MGATLTLSAYNDAVALGHFLVTRCLSCGAQDAIPTASCFRCGHPQLRIEPHPGAGSLFSWVVCHYAFDPALANEVPYTVIVVELTGGGRVYGRLDAVPAVGSPLHAGLELELNPVATAERRFPVFRRRA
jgi:uncharacterized OB-fold protein